jgi:hypothetical protein
MSDGPSAEDARILARAVLEGYSWYEDEGYYIIGGRDGFHCEYCEAPMADTPEELKHVGHCPVLVARDVLTGETP